MNARPDPLVRLFDGFPLDSGPRKVRAGVGARHTLSVVQFQPRKPIPVTRRYRVAPFGVRERSSRFYALIHSSQIQLAQSVTAIALYSPAAGGAPPEPLDHHGTGVNLKVQRPACARAPPCCAHEKRHGSFRTPTS